MDDLKTEKWTLDDGRRAERRVMENTTENGQSETVIELHVEDERPLKLQQRVVEKSKPIVYERMVETIDPKTGDVVEQRVESIEPKIQMQLVEHISSCKANAQPIKECDCHVTKEEMIDTIVAAIKAARENSTVSSQTVVGQNNFKGKLNSLGLADEIADRVGKPNNPDKIMYGIIAAEVVALVYIMFFM
jgi:primase-polymerase (primpol)-like protein